MYFVYFVVASAVFGLNAMRIVVCILALLFAASSYGDALPVAVRRSLQFTVADVRSTSARSPGELRGASGQPLIKLDADVLLLSAERIREMLVKELGVASDKPGRISLVLYLASRADELVGVTSVLSPDGWDYRVEIPDQIQARHLVRGIVHPVLLELANRGQGPKSAELPIWLVEGITAHLMAVAGPDLVVSAVPVGSMLRIVRERRGLDYLRGARDVLRAAGPPSFSDLVYPKPESLAGAKLKTYQAAAQLFVYELLHSPNGPADFVRMLRALPNCWNWELALLRGFSDQFHRTLDVEKKWSVDVLAFTARDASQVWSRIASLDRLDEVLAVRAQLRVTADSMPGRTTVSLQKVLSTWDPQSQITVARQKLSLLQVLRYNSSPELIPLIDSYSRTLATYLQKRDQAMHTPETRMQPTYSASLVAQEAIRELELLDKRREGFRPEKVLSVNSPISP